LLLRKTIPYLSVISPGWILTELPSIWNAVLALFRPKHAKKREITKDCPDIIHSN
jgi:hypothetical protein